MVKSLAEIPNDFRPSNWSTPCFWLGGARLFPPSYLVVLVLSLYLKKYLHIYTLSLFAILTVVSIVSAHDSLNVRKIQLRIDNQKLNVPAGPPPISQDSIDLALKIYNIETPPGATSPRLDLTLADRGVTAISGLASKKQVTIGPSAFTSWSVLGSTLAHEIEVHCHQSFGLIRLLDILDLDGTVMAERQAYLHEIHGAGRFGLSEDEVLGIQDTMNFYYPVAGDDDSFAARISDSVSSFLAK